ncbi:Cytochrome P450 monooxygenase apf7 [Lachnellula suecica]|uniref:Cytochrome P450 monooxygenase apf7 n=1 Tax=Lachnellula suecica TaxID=602035 RepID=A0A8T9CH23_9HELO|nr:Cytochrome P450 monooxygenase apf7 [Lachnellula suecica]
MFGGNTLSYFGLVVKYAGSTFVLYYLLLFAYRLLLHPLRSYPGPLLAKITDGYGGLHALLRNLPLTTYNDHLKHGCVIRAGPNRLVFNTTTALQKIYNNERTTKSHVYLKTVQASGIESIFNCTDRDRHRSKRKMIGKVVSDRSIRLFEPTIKDQIQIFLQLLLASSQEPNPRPVNMSERCKRLGLDVIGLLAFGFPLNTQTDEEYRFIIKAVTFGNLRANSFMQLPALKNRFLDPILHVLTRKKRLAYLKALELMISTRLAVDKDANIDFYSFIAEHIETGGPESIRLAELWSEAIFFFPAGGDTTATAITALFFYLSRNPESYRKLVKEVRNAFADASEIKGGPQLSGCRYLRACIDESLRISPPVGGTLWYELAEGELEKGGPLVVDGHVIPPGTSLGVNIYSLHHNEDYFPDAFTFRPERWMTADQAALHRMNSAFNAFSTGPRGCAGKSMAYLEAGMVIAKTLWYFDFETAPGPAGAVGAGRQGKGMGREREGEFQLYDGFTSSHDGPNLVFHTRGDYWKDLE